MHILTVSKPFTKGSVSLSPGEYMLADYNAFEFGLRGAGTLRYQFIDTDIGLYDDYNDETIVIGHSGAFGDQLMLTPALHRIKEKWPTCRLHVACFDLFASVFDHNPDVDVAGFYPLKEEIWQKAYGRVWLENVLEESEAGRTVPAIDLFARKMGLGELTDKKIRYYMTDAERYEAIRRFPKGTKKRIGYQLDASSPSRTYPGDKAGAMGRMLHDKGYEIVLFGAPIKERMAVRPDVIDLTQQDPPLTFRESAAVMATLDGFIGPDSVWIHMAGALDIPAVGLFSVIPWHLRTGYAEKTFAIQGKCPISPCFFHQRGGKLFPENGPCHAAGKCTALDEIEPARVVAKLESLL